MQTPADAARSRENNKMMNTREKEDYIENCMFPFCDESGKYEKVAKIGQGTFGYDFIMSTDALIFHTHTFC